MLECTFVGTEYVNEENVLPEGKHPFLFFILLMYFHVNKMKNLTGHRIFSTELWWEFWSFLAGEILHLSLQTLQLYNTWESNSVYQQL
jgi:hypothetical protein